MPSKITTIILGLTLCAVTCVGASYGAGPEYKRHYDLGMDFLNRDQYKLAIAEFDLAIKNSQSQSSDTARVLVERGTAYNELKNYTKALADLDRALQLEPNNDLGLNNRGAVYLRTFRPQLAAMDFDRSLKVNPDNKYAVVNRAGAFLLEKDPGSKVASTLSWLNSGKHWQSDFAGHAAVQTALAYLLSKDKAGFNNMVDNSLKHLDRLKWPYQVFQYFKGKKTVDDVLEAAEDSTYNLMQAQCFLAIESYSRGDLDQAMTRLDFVTKHGTVNSVEYWVGKNFLERINKQKSLGSIKPATSKATK